MIVFDLSCAEGHRFEGWFSSSGDYADQKASGLLACPQCGSASIDKAPMAPAVPAKGNTARSAVQTDAAAPSESRAVANQEMPAEVKEALVKLAEAQSRALKKSTWVGEDFAETSRAMHYGERDEAPIHGRATPEEARALAEEGIPVAPLIVPVAPPDEVN